MIYPVVSEIFFSAYFKVTAYHHILMIARI
ncbi:unnamed protein product [Oikopleura dioica]|uniref:Uncharacterized protein n=1 Tax=Oikopleura dioica TaxID=34765 RepID=E4X1U1_OIKDI|nr:unnamed protein product [Oikopleura dioica]